MPRSRWLICIAIFSMLLCLLALPFAYSGFIYRTHATLASAGSTSMTSLTGSLPPEVAHSQVIGSVEPQRPLSLSINLNLNNVSVLKQYIQALYTPGSYLYHHYLKPAQFAAMYGPSTHEIQQVSDYLREKGFTITHAVAGQQVIDFSGSVAQVEEAFGVQIRTYRAQDGHIFYANSAAPRVPLSVRSLISNINGLSNAVLRQHPPLWAQPINICRGRLIAPTADLSAPCVHLPGHVQPGSSSPHTISCPAPGSSSLKYYIPSQFATAYNFTGLYNAGYHGEGQSVALFELDSYTPGDISSYQSCFDKNATTRINTQLIDGGPQSQGAGGLEVDMDMQLLLGMLPGLSNLFVYEAPNTSTAYNDEWMQILTDDIPVVSTSWGICEADLSASDITAEQQFFMQAAAQGQSLLAASGDSGAYDCGDSTLAVDDPASNPYMTGVGGTHLALNSDNSYNSESGWSNSPGPNYASGGGISQLWTMPTYQSGPGVINSYSSGSPCHAMTGQYCREVPDISLDADPETGYVVYCTIVVAGCQSSALFVHVGGTSAATPMWTTVIVLANQYALAHGANNLGFLNPIIYTLLNTNSLYSPAFHDVTSGTNLYYPATPAYDMVTGAGTCNAYGFAIAAVSLPGSRVVPANAHWYFAEGHVGNNFQEYLTLENPSVSSPAHVVVNYLLRGTPSLNQSLTLNPSTRTTVNVNGFLGVAGSSNAGQDVSLYITSDIPIMTERPIYFIYKGIMSGGSDIFGVTQPGQHFTFANGETLAGFETYLTILNPLGQSQATITVKYYSSGALIGQSTLIVPPGQRNTLMANHDFPAGKQFWMQVDSDQAVVVERPMYFRTPVQGIASNVAGGSSIPGVSPTTNWYFPDGYTGGQGAPSQENLILANPDANGSGFARIRFSWRTRMQMDQEPQLL